MLSPSNSSIVEERELPDATMVARWKVEFGSVFHVQILEWTCFYRKLKIIEYLRIEGASLSELDKEEAITREALLYPGFDSLEDSYAGVISTLALCILRSSRLEPTSLETERKIPLLDSWNKQVDKEKRKILPRPDTTTGVPVIDKPIIPLILDVVQAMPAYRPEELLMMDMDQLLERVAWAQYMSGNIPADAKRYLAAQYGGITPPSTNQPTNAITPGQFGYTQDQLEAISAQASAKALTERMMRERGNAFRTIPGGRQQKRSSR